MTFWELANTSVLWILVLIGLLFVFGLCIFFFIKAKNQCVALGIEKDIVQKIITSSVVFSVVPSLSIVIGLLSLATLLGRPWSWFRLSVVGSVSYELLAADLASQALGVENLSLLRDKPGTFFVAIMIVMSIGILSNNVFNVFFAKKITTSLTEYNKKHGVWGTLLTGSFVSTMILVFFLVQIFAGLVPMLTVVTSTIIAFGLSGIAKKYKVYWLENFILSITLILGMTAGWLWSELFAL